MLAAAWFTAVATGLLALFAVVTAWYARKAFREQAKELSALQRQAEGTTKMMEIQSGQLAAQREQLAGQREVNERQLEVLVLQASELEVLVLQASELKDSISERQAAREQRHRAQAARVFISQEVVLADKTTAWFEAKAGREAPPSVTATVHNKSDDPAYNVQLRWHRGSASHGDPNPESLPPVMPGGTASRLREFPADSDFDRDGAVVVFRDAAGATWLRRPDGDLQEQQT